MIIIVTHIKKETETATEMKRITVRNNYGEEVKQNKKTKNKRDCRLMLVAMHVVVQSVLPRTESQRYTT